MLFANAVFNVLTGVFDVTKYVLRVLNYVRQNIAVVFLNLTLCSSKSGSSGSLAAMVWCE